MCSKSNSPDIMHHREGAQKRSSSRRSVRQSCTREDWNSQEARKRNGHKFGLVDVCFYGFLLFVCFDTYITKEKYSALRQDYTRLKMEKKRFREFTVANMTCDALVASPDSNSNQAIEAKTKSLLKEYNIVSKKFRDLLLDLQTQTSKHEDFKAMVSEELDFLYDKEDQYEQKVKALTSELEEVKGKYAYVKSQVRDLHEEDQSLDSSRKSDLDRNGERDMLKQEIENYKQQVADLNKKLNEIQRVYDKDELMFVYEELRNFEQGFFQLRDNLAKANVEIEDLKRENDCLSKSLDASLDNCQNEKYRGE